MATNAHPIPAAAEASARRPLWPLEPGERPIVVIAVIGLAVSLGVALATHAYEFLFYIAVLVVIAVAVLLLHRKVTLALATLWCLLAWAAAHLCGGMVKLPAPTGVLYNFWLIPDRLKYDQVVHAFGFGVSTWICWQALRWRLARGDGDARPTAGMVSLCALAGMGLGALNEVVEFTATRLVPNTNVGGYENNAWDLVFNMTGSAIAAAAIWWHSPGSPAAPRRA